MNSIPNNGSPGKAKAEARAKKQKEEKPKSKRLPKPKQQNRWDEARAARAEQAHVEPVASPAPPIQDQHSWEDISWTKKDTATHSESQQLCKLQLGRVPCGLFL